MKKKQEYCSDCLNVFPTEELQSCICSLGEWDKTIVTKAGVKVIKDRGLFCKNCLGIHHKHIGETFI